MRRFEEVLLLDVCRLDLNTGMDPKEDTEHRVSVPAPCSIKWRGKNADSDLKKPLDSQKQNSIHNNPGLPEDTREMMG